MFTPRTIMWSKHLGSKVDNVMCFIFKERLL